MHIQRVWDENKQVYGAKKVWLQLRRDGIQVARCTVERLMKHLGLRGAVRGKKVKTTWPDKTAARPDDLLAVAVALNSRPRKPLGWQTPAEALNNHVPSVQQGTVAMTT